MRITTNQKGKIMKFNTKIYALGLVGSMLVLGGGEVRAASSPLPMCLASETPDPCGRQIVARGSIEISADGDVVVYESSSNVLGAAAIGYSKLQVLLSTKMSSLEYQVIVSGAEEVPSGKSPSVGRFDKWNSYFRINTASPMRSGQKQWIDFIVVGR